MPKRGAELGFSKNLSNLQASIQPLVPKCVLETYRIIVLQPSFNPIIA